MVISLQQSPFQPFRVQTATGNETLSLFCFQSLQSMISEAAAAANHRLKHKHRPHPFRRFTNHLGHCSPLRRERRTRTTFLMTCCCLVMHCFSSPLTAPCFPSAFNVYSTSLDLTLGRTANTCCFACDGDEIGLFSDQSTLHYREGYSLLTFPSSFSRLLHFPSHS
jgi:hypothetical protein